MRKARLSQDILQQLITLFIAGTPARTSAKLCEINFKTAVQWYHRFRAIIYTHVQTEHYVEVVPMVRSVFVYKQVFKNIIQ